MSYPCKDNTRPICRQFVNRGKCTQHNNCRFYHPELITPIIKKKASRQLGYCYCGAPQRRLINKSKYRLGEEGDVIFFIVCAATGRSMRHCIK